MSKNCATHIPVSPHTCQIPLSTAGIHFFKAVINCLLSSWEVAGTVLGAGDEMRNSWPEKKSLQYDEISALSGSTRTMLEGPLTQIRKSRGSLEGRDF